MSYLRLSIMLLVLFITGLNFAQEVTPDAPINIDFVSFTLDDPEISGVAPVGWDEVVTGSYVNPDNEDNSTYILHLASSTTTLDDFVQTILESFSQESLPNDNQTYELDNYTWSLYNFEYTPVDDSEPLVVDIATATRGALVLVVVLQSEPFDYEQLHESVFLTSLDYFGQPLPFIRDELGHDLLIPATIVEFGIDTRIPAEWENLNPGSYIRGDLQVDPTTLLIQTSSDLEEDEFRDLFLERLMIDLTAEGEVYSSDDLEWTIHTIDIEIEGTALTWQLATAGDESYAYLVVVFSFTEESTILRHTILLPVLDATQELASQ